MSANSVRFLPALIIILLVMGFFGQIPLWLALAGSALCLFFILRHLFQNKSGNIMQRRRFIRDFAFPRSSLSRLQQEAEAVLQRPLNDAELALTAAALRQFFIASLMYRPQTLSMPSFFADALWHGLIQDTRRYQQFCEMAFGDFFHHTPHNGHSDPDALLRTWIACCAQEQLDPAQAEHLPALFALDQSLGHGFQYALGEDCLLCNGRKVLPLPVQTLMQQMPSSPQLPHSAGQSLASGTPLALAAGGALLWSSYADGSTLEEDLTAQRNVNTSSSSSDFESESVGRGECTEGSEDGACNDSGGDSGDSGSSCGGGCGGGGGD